MLSWQFSMVFSELKIVQQLAQTFSYLHPIKDYGEHIPWPSVQGCISCLQEKRNEKI